VTPADESGAWSHLVSAPEKHGLCLVTADYRLAPQTRMPGIMADIKAVMDYLGSPAFLSETNHAVDQSKIVVSGGSAGGWLALLVASGIGFEACGLEPPAKPLAVAPLYPMTDITDRFFTTKQHRGSPAWERAHR
jgi:acetyl esterase/lipase